MDREEILGRIRDYTSVVITLGIQLYIFALWRVDKDTNKEKEIKKELKYCFEILVARNSNIWWNVLFIQEKDFVKICNCPHNVFSDLTKLID